MVKRYRNSPSIIIWSIGNEEWQLQRNGGAGRQGSRHHGPALPRTRPDRVVSAAVNGDNEKGVSDAFDIIGFNYNLSFPTGITRSIPSAPSMDRRLPAHQHARRIRHRQAAQHGQRLRRRGAMGRDAEEWWKFLRHARLGSRRLCLDRLRLSRRADALRLALHQLAVRHRGHVRFSQGHFYYYKAWWGKEPSLHLFPHWNFEGREGDEIPVWVYSNLWMRSNCSSTARAWAARRSRTWVTWSGR
jgi:beta-galactosidase